MAYELMKKPNNLQGTELCLGRVIVDDHIRRIYVLPPLSVKTGIEYAFRGLIILAIAGTMIFGTNDLTDDIISNIGEEALNPFLVFFTIITVLIIAALDGENIPFVFFGREDIEIQGTELKVKRWILPIWNVPVKYSLDLRAVQIEPFGPLSKPRWTPRLRLADSNGQIIVGRGLSVEETSFLQDALKNMISSHS